VSTVAKSALTPQEYLAKERKADFKSEYYRGEMFAMAGASEEHNSIVTNVVGELHPQLKQHDCKVYASDMRVKVDPTGLYTYPDVSVACEGREFEDEELDALLNPQVIFEVLSKSTEAYDRGPKFEQYRKLSSLSEYLLVSQDRCHVEHYEKQADGSWTLREFNDLQEVVVLRSIECKLTLADIYLKVRLPSKPE
jgi:Uma2 family endonuclease